jgi:hypothetical protein
MVNYYVPQGLPKGCKIPMLHFSNGTALFCGYYQIILDHLASHGFLVSCFESPMTGAGDGCMTALDGMMTKYSALVDNTFGSTGHSQGGSASITCAYLAEKKYGDKLKIAVAAIQPATGMSRFTYAQEFPLVKSPIFIMSGTNDELVSDDWIKMGYNILTAPTIWLRSLTTEHLLIHNPVKISTLAYFRWKLLDDQSSGDYFNKLTNDPTKWVKVGTR